MPASNLCDSQDASRPCCGPEKDLPSPPSSQKPRKHRPAPLDLSPGHLSPLDSTNPNAIEEYLFSSSPLQSPHSAVGMGLPSPAHYSQNDLLNILDSNPPLTPVPPLRMTTTTMTDTLRPETPGTVPLSPGLPPASHSDTREGPMDEIFLELLHTEKSFLSELDTIDTIVRDILIPLSVVDAKWHDAVDNLKSLHDEFVQHLGAGDRAGITPVVLETIVKWPSTAEPPYREYINAFRLGLDSSLAAVASESHISRLAEIKMKIVPEGSEQVTLDYLFKRPLVRLRYYSKLYKYWTHFPPQIIDGDAITTLNREVKDELFTGHDRFKVLVSFARSRVSEEKSRIQSDIKEIPETPLEPLETLAKIPQTPKPHPEPQETLSTLLQNVDCTRCKELTNTNSKDISLTKFISSNPGEPLFHRELYSSLPDETFPNPPRQASHIIILSHHLILLGLTAPPSPPTKQSQTPDKSSTKWLMFPPIFGAALNIFTTETCIEIILGGGATVRFDKTDDLESALRDLRQRSIDDEGGRSPRPGFQSPTIGDMLSPTLGGGMRRSPAMDALSPRNITSPRMGWTLTDSVGETKKVELTRGWSFETRPRANTEPPRRDPPTPPQPQRDSPTPPRDSPTLPATEDGEKRGHKRDDSVSLVRGVLKMSPSPSPTPSPPLEKLAFDDEIRFDTPPPKMASLRRGSSPIRKSARSIKKDSSMTSLKSPIPPVPRIPRSPSLPKEATFPKEYPSRSPSLPREQFGNAQLSATISRSVQPRSLSPSRSVPVQLKDLPHFPATPTKHDPVPTLPALEFGQSPLGMRGYLARNSSPRKTPADSPRRPQVDGSPLANRRLATSSSQTCLHSPGLSPIMRAKSPRAPSPARTMSPGLASTISTGRISPSPTVCTFPPRTMRDENDRLAGTRSVDDLRRTPRSGAKSRLDHRDSTSSGSASVEEDDLVHLSTNISGVGRILHHGGCIVYFWKRGGWHHPDSHSDESSITVESFGAAGRGRAASISPPKVVLRVLNTATQGVVVQHEILPTASIRRDSPSEVSIGCDVMGGKKEYYMFACHDPGEADGLFHALNTGRYFVGGVTEEQLRQATSLFGRTTSFASSLATNSSVGSNISNYSIWDTPPLPTMPAEYSPVEDIQSDAPLVLEEKLLVHDHKVKIFLRQDAGIWKNLGNGKVSVFTTGPEVRVHVVQPTKKDASAVLVDGRIFESGACERVGRTGVAINLPGREGKIAVYMLQSKNDKEAQVVYEAIRKGRPAV